MIFVLTWFIRSWVAAMVALNIVAMVLVPHDPSSNALLGDPFASLELLASPVAALAHLGFLAGNLLLILPVAAAAAWRQTLAKKSVA